jgi:NAD(P)-dependent dehydrogenase (short-subunit alcohol dehydrogenase family)
MYSNPFSLEGKKIFVTGASSGIGRAVAVECSKMGAMVIFTGRNRDRLQETYKSLSGDNHRWISADLNDKDDVKSIIDCLPDLDGVVHCAGIVKTLPFRFINQVDLQSVMETNFIAPVLLNQHLVKTKRIKRDSSVVFISSISGVFCSMPGNSIYSASKGAINGMMKGMALDLAPVGIRVNSVTPGMIETNLLSDNSSITSEQLQENIKKYPLKRYGKPEEVAYAVIYLLSDASKWVTGSNLLIDGGYTLL